MPSKLQILASSPPSHGICLTATLPSTGAATIAQKDDEGDAKDEHRAQNQSHRGGLVIGGRGIQHVLLGQQLEVD